MSKETHAFKSFKSFQHAIEGMVSISKQNEGWIKSLGRSVTVVGEEDRYLTRVKERLPKYSLVSQQ